MIKSSQTIEINGKRYDAKTGQVIKSPSSASIPATHQTQSPKRRAGTVSDISRSQPTTSHKVHKPAQRSQTLIRQAVKKPAKPAAVKQVKSRTSQDIKPAKKQHTGLVTHHQDIARQARASKVKQSKLVSKFSGNKTTQHPLATSPVASRVQPLAVQPAPALTHPANSILEAGLRNAQSHTQAFDNKKSGKKPKKTRKLVSYGAGALAAVLLIAFIGYQNIPNLSVRYASTRSGVQASLPDYKPAGFSMSHKVQYNPGQITVNFASNSDDRNFTITQRESSWNSDALLSSYVTAQSDQVQKYEDKGRTIFLYGNSNATWVNGGVWYEVSGDSQLNSDQLIRIASSM